MDVAQPVVRIALIHMKSILHHVTNAFDVAH